MYKNWKIKKSDFNQKEYSKVVKWCDDHGYRIMADDTYYYTLLIPEQLPLTHDEIKALREDAYKINSDPITAHIQVLRDEEQTDDVIAEIATLIEERRKIRLEIKEKYPYPDEN